MTCSVPGDFDYTGYSDRALGAALHLWRSELSIAQSINSMYGDKSQIPADVTLARHKIAAIKAEIERRVDKETHS